MIGEDSPITIGLAVIIFGGLAGLWWRIEARFARHTTALEKEADARLIIERDLASYKVWVAQNHVSATMLRETEERLIAAVDKLASRLETIVGRLDKMATDILRRE